MKKGKKYPVEVLSASEARSLVDACSSTCPSGIRNSALIVTLYRAGLRVSEALGLYPKDIDSFKGTIRVLEGKGRKARTVGLDPASFEFLNKWKLVRESLGINGDVPLFCTLNGRRIYTSYVRALLKRLADRAGIEKRVHPHGLRHTMAAQLAEEGVPMNLIQRQLGHSSLATTSRYLDHIAPTQLIEAMQSREWTV